MSNKDGGAVKAWYLYGFLLAALLLFVVFCVQDFLHNRTGVAVFELVVALVCACGIEYVRRMERKYNAHPRR